MHTIAHRTLNIKIQAVLINDETVTKTGIFKILK